MTCNITACKINDMHAGMDFNITEPLPVQLEFAPTESRLGVPMTIFEDQILEPRESFVLQLSIPVDPPIGYMLGAPSTTTVHIDDNERECLLPSSR